MICTQNCLKQSAESAALLYAQLGVLSGKLNPLYPGLFGGVDLTRTGNSRSAALLVRRAPQTATEQALPRRIDNERPCYVSSRLCW